MPVPKFSRHCSTAELILYTQPSFLMTETVKPSGPSRLEVLRERLAKARSENLEAVATEGRRPSERGDREPGNGEHGHVDGRGGGKEDGLSPSRKEFRKRKRVFVEGLDDEPDGLISKAMRGRVERMNRAAKIEAGVDVNKVTSSSRNDTEVSQVVYGGRGTLAVGAADRVANELADMEARRHRSKKVREFDEEKGDIGFINEPNRRFNAMLDKHYDKYDSVRDVKESLERGTALP